MRNVTFIDVEVIDGTFLVAPSYYPSKLSEQVGVIAKPTQVHIVSIR